MNLSAAIYAIRWLVRDTFRQARASGISWVMLGVSGSASCFCLSVSVQRSAVAGPRRRAGRIPAAERPVARSRHRRPSKGVDLAGGEMTLAFGAVRLPLGATPATASASSSSSSPAAWPTPWACCWPWSGRPASCRLSSSPEPPRCSLAKPVPRWSLLAGKYLGVLAFVAFQALVFVGGTWAGAGAAHRRLGPGVPVVRAAAARRTFAIFFSFSVLLAVCTRSTVACVIGSLLFWLLCWGMNYGRHLVAGRPRRASVAPLAGVAGRGRLLGAAEAGRPQPDPVRRCWRPDTTSPRGWRCKTCRRRATSIPSGRSSPRWRSPLVMLYVAGRQFVTTDY